MSSVIIRLWVWIFARTRFRRLNRFLFLVSLRGLGILNFGSMRESGERNFLKKLLPAYAAANGKPLVILDVGANVGSYAKEVVSIASEAKIYCFEPHPINVDKLRQAVGSAARIVPCAVGAAAGSMELFDYSDEDGSSHASLYREVFEKIHRRPHVSHAVEVVTVDEFVEKSSIANIALLKIDTEGHELAVLSGASRTLKNGRIDVVHFEFNEMNIASRTFLGDFFEALPGFRLYRLLIDGWIPLRDQPLENIYAYQNIIAVREGSLAEQALN